MSYNILIFCRENPPVTRKELADFIREGAFFDNSLELLPSPDETESADPYWQTLAMKYDAVKPAIVICRHAENEFLREQVRTITFVLEVSKDTNTKQHISHSMQATVLLFSIEITDRELLPEDCWEMLDALESYLARKCHGIIYAPGQGFYDPDLRHIYKL